MPLPTWKECLPYVAGVGVIVFLGVYPKIRENMPVGDSIETCWRFPDECNKLHPEEYVKEVAWMLGNCVRSLWPHPEDCETRLPNEYRELYEDVKRKVKNEMDNDDKACGALERATQGRRLCGVDDDREDER